MDITDHHLNHHHYHPQNTNTINPSPNNHNYSLTNLISPHSFDNNHVSHLNPYSAAASAASYTDFSEPPSYMLNPPGLADAYIPNHIPNPMINPPTTLAHSNPLINPYHNASNHPYSQIICGGEAINQRLITMDRQIKAEISDANCLHNLVDAEEPRLCKSAKPRLNVKSEATINSSSRLSGSISAFQLSRPAYNSSASCNYVTGSANHTSDSANHVSDSANHLPESARHLSGSTNRLLGSANHLADSANYLPRPANHSLAGSANYNYLSGSSVNNHVSGSATNHCLSGISANQMSCSPNDLSGGPATNHLSSGINESNHQQRKCPNFTNQNKSKPKKR